MTIYRVKLNASGTKYHERHEYLVRANHAKNAIDKAMAQARREGVYKRYYVESVELIGDAL